MIISTPKIDDLNDSNTLTMNNTFANAQITADEWLNEYSNAKKHASLNSTSTSNSTAVSNENSLQPRRKHRANSAPAAHGYVNRVGFDTITCNYTSEYAFSLQSRTEGWKRTKNSRTFLVGTDLTSYSAHALQYVVESMVEDGDEIVALRVVPNELRESWFKGSNTSSQDSVAKSEANIIAKSIRERNVAGKEINIIIEVQVGIIRDSFQNMIKLYQPDVLVVGSRGRTGVKGILSSSVSRYCLNQCLVPVMIVRPERKLNKSKNKAKGIFRTRSSTDDHGYQVNTGQSLQISNSEYDFRNTLTVNGRNTLARTVLFPSATVHAGDKFPGMNSSTQSTTTPLSSLFTPPPPKGTELRQTTSNISTSGSIPSTSSAISHSASTPSISFTPGTRSPMPPPPEGMIKMKKSLTTDGTEKDGKGGFRGKISSFLGRSDKKVKKRNSQG